MPLTLWLDKKSRGQRRQVHIDALIVNAALNIMFLNILYECCEVFKYTVGPAVRLLACQYNPEIDNSCHFTVIQVVECSLPIN